MSRFLLFVLVLWLTACSTPGAQKADLAPKSEEGKKQRLSRQRRGEAGQFDFYVLALSWSPSYCATPAGQRDDLQCAPQRNFAFVLHGLWPQYEKRGWPQNCGAER